ncbi:hypothetical protein SprV_0501907200 [Sparganum proliferum]
MGKVEKTRLQDAINDLVFYGRYVDDIFYLADGGWVYPAQGVPNKPSSSSSSAASARHGIVNSVENSTTFDAETFERINTPGINTPLPTPPATPSKPKHVLKSKANPIAVSATRTPGWRLRDLKDLAPLFYYWLHAPIDLSVHNDHTTAYCRPTATVASVLRFEELVPA